MIVTLTPEMERLVTKQVESGSYASPAEVVDDALRLLGSQQIEQFERLRHELQIGIDQLDRGEYREYDSDGLKSRFEEIKQLGRMKLELERRA